MDYCDLTPTRQRFIVERGKALNKQLNRKSHITLAIAFDLGPYMGLDDPDYAEVMEICASFLPMMVGVGLCNLGITKEWFDEMVFLRLGFERVDPDNVEFYNKVAAFVRRRAIACSRAMPSSGECVFEYVNQEGFDRVILVVRYFSAEGEPPRHGGTFY